VTDPERPWEQEAPEAFDPKPESSKVGRGCGLGCGGFIVALVVFAVAASCGGDNDKPREPDQYDAKAMCHDWVKERLKAPSTAKFNNENVSGSAYGGFTITGAVDSENSFGGTVRSSWTCTLKLTADGKQWQGGTTVDG